MKPFRITTSGGEMLIVTFAGLDQKLADVHYLPDVLTAILQHGEATIELKDGQTAIVVRHTEETLRQEVLPLPTHAMRPAFGRDYEMSAQVLFELPAHISCRARMESEAALIAEEVLLGLRGAPAGFRVEISQDDQEAFITGLEIAQDGAPRALGVRGVTVTGINERILLEGPRA